MLNSLFHCQVWYFIAQDCVIVILIYKRTSVLILSISDFQSMGPCVKQILRFHFFGTSVIGISLVQEWCTFVHTYNLFMYFFMCDYSSVPQPFVRRYEVFSCYLILGFKILFFVSVQDALASLLITKKVLEFFEIYLWLNEGRCNSLFRHTNWTWRLQLIL